jgi:hypothetical protein
LSTILDRYIPDKRDNEQISVNPRVLCPICLKDRHKSKVYKNRRTIFLHITQHQVAEPDKKGLKILVGQYFKMNQMGIIQ